jgi:hypothetical protein
VVVVVVPAAEALVRLTVVMADLEAVQLILVVA